MLMNAIEIVKKTKNLVDEVLKLTCVEGGTSFDTLGIRQAWGSVRREFDSREFARFKENYGMRAVRASRISEGIGSENIYLENFLNMFSYVTELGIQIEQVRVNSRNIPLNFASQLGALSTCLQTMEVDHIPALCGAYPYV